MKMLFIIILSTFIGDGSSITKTSKANKAKEEAKNAFEAKKYDEAIKAYSYLLDSLKIDDENAAINLAHSYYLSNDSTSALRNYTSLTASKNREIQSIAHQQLGVISEKQQDYKNALSHFKNALKANPNNSEARFNYELVKKKLQQQEQQNQDKKDNQKQDQKNENQDKKDQQNQDKKDQGDKNKDQNQDNQKKDDQNKDGQQDDKKEGKDGEKKENEKKDSNQKGDDGKKSEEEKKKEEQKSKGENGEPKDENQEGKEDQLTPEEKKKQEEEVKKQAQAQRFQNVDMSEEKAKMILNAMKQSEKQYLQQLQKQSTERPDSDKPDW